MGGSAGKEELDPALRSGKSSASAVASGSKPYFFLASCPDDSLQAAVDLADRFGGFHCVDGDDGFEAWKGRAAGQFTTLKRLSPPGRKVVGIAIAGFGHCNEEREFLRQLANKRGHEQFELKQCGDVQDMERWLLSEGYEASGKQEQGSVATAPPSPEESGRTQAVATIPGLWASAANFFGSRAEGGGPRPGNNAWKERWLMDVQRALHEAEGAEGAERLRSAGEGLGGALEKARGAGVPEEDLEEAVARHEELAEQLRLATRSSCSCSFCCWCCCTEARGMKKADEQQESLFSTADTKFAESQKALKGPEESSNMRTVLPFRAQVPLPLGTECRYRSPKNGWLAAVVVGFNESDGTCNLDIKKHAKPELIFPAGHVGKARSWPVGTLVEYESSSAGQWLEASISAFNEAVGKGDCSYDLDVRQNAGVDRIRLRIA